MSENRAKQPGQLLCVFQSVYFSVIFKNDGFRTSNVHSLYIVIVQHKSRGGEHFLIRRIFDFQQLPIKVDDKAIRTAQRHFISSIFIIFDPKRHLPYWACARALSVRAALWACIYNIVTYEPNSGCKNFKKKIQDKKYLQCGMNMMKICMYVCMYV